MNNHSVVWVFNGIKGNFPSAVFSKRELAEEWIEKNKLAGVLTAYPVDISIYDWAVDNEYFVPKKEAHFGSEFIAEFSSANQEHYHYEDGKVDS